MKPEWAVRLNLQQAAAAKVLRHFAGVEVCEPAEAVWLRGEKMDEYLELALRKLPNAERFTVLADGQLLPVGKRVPRGRSPAAEWIPIQRWVTLDPQPGAFGGELAQQVTLRLVRSSAEQEAMVLVIDMARWLDFATAAPEIRLRRLTFAVAADGRVLVRGMPLPPAPGNRYAEQNGVAVPAGFTLWPQLEPAVIHELLDLSRGDLALFSSDGSFERVPAANFVQATRSAVRLTTEGLRQ